MAVWYLASYWVKLQQVLCYAEYYDTLNYTEFSKTVDFLPVLILLLLFFFFLMVLIYYKNYLPIYFKIELAHYKLIQISAVLFFSTFACIFVMFLCFNSVNIHSFMKFLTADI